ASACEWGGTYDFKRDTDDSDFYERGKNRGRYVYHQPPALNDGWPTQSPEEAAIDCGGVEATFQMLIDRPIDSNDVPLVDALLLACSHVCRQVETEATCWRKETSAYVPRQTRRSHSGGHRFDPVQLHQNQSIDGAARVL